MLASLALVGCSVSADSHKFDLSQQNSEEVAKQSSAGCKRIHQALPYLRSEYGTQYRTPEGKHRIKLDWPNIPDVAILDKIYGLDAV